MTGEPIYFLGMSLTGYLIALVYVHLVVWWLIRYGHVIRDVFQCVMESLPARRRTGRLADAWDRGYTEGQRYGESPHAHEVGNPYRRSQ